jgi:ribonuclease BN (tRNA processing enzyme)
VKIRVLGSSGSHLPGHNLPAFLVDDYLLLDAGTIGHALERRVQKKISHILITHAHLDHIRDIAFFLDNLMTDISKRQVTLLSGKDVLNDIKRNIFNDRIWPDFSSLPDKGYPLLKYQEVPLRGYVQIGGYRILAAPVNHSVPAYGYIIEDSGGKAIAYTGDTGPTERLWKRMSGYNVKALIIEVTFPDSLNELAIQTGHLTPSLLSGELKKMTPIPEKVYVTHVKPQHRKSIEKGLKKIKSIPLEVLDDRRTISV